MCQIVQLDQQKETRYVETRGFHGINKAILKNWVYLQNTHSSPATHSMIQTWCQINAMSKYFYLKGRFAKYLSCI